jgi:hypothetical protein
MLTLQQLQHVPADTNTQLQDVCTPASMAQCPGHRNAPKSEEVHAKNAHASINS